MRAEERSALQTAHVDLIRDMNPAALRDLLFAKRLLTTDECERLDSMSITSDKNRYIARLLPRKGANAFREFIACLRETGEENGAHIDLANDLESHLHDE